MITSIRWDKMFGPDAGKGVDLEHILPLGGHLYVVGINWAYVNPTWVHAFPFLKVRDWVTNTPQQLHQAKESREEYIRLHTNEPVEEVPDEQKRARDQGNVQRELRRLNRRGPNSVNPRGI